MTVVEQSVEKKKKKREKRAKDSSPIAESLYPWVKAWKTFKQIKKGDEV